MVDEDFPSLPQRLSARQWLVIDVVVAALLAVVTIAGTAAGLDRRDSLDAVWDVSRYLLIVVACVALPFRRRYPKPVLAVVASAVIGVIAVGSRGPMTLAVLLAVYTVAALCAPRTSFKAAVVVILGVIMASLVADHHPSLVGPPLIGIGWLAGQNTRTRRAYLAGVEQWAADRDRQRDERSRRAVTDERLRIARELHDVVAHAMSVVAVRSGVARAVLDSRPEEVGPALEIIETTSRRAMHEMRLLVGVLRDGDAAAGELDAATAPAPGLADLPRLVEEIGAAGVAVDVRVSGQMRPLPAGVDVSAFRIVQEALTNVVRHAGPARARLELRYRPDWVEIDVTDNGGGGYPRYPGPSAAGGAGHGLVGMRERVALFGGTFRCGPTATGFGINALLPTGDRRPDRS